MSRAPNKSRNTRFIEASWQRNVERDPLKTADPRCGVERCRPEYTPVSLWRVGSREVAGKGCLRNQVCPFGQPFPFAPFP
jgi:hypothetical protein